MNKKVVYTGPKLEYTITGLEADVLYTVRVVPDSCVGDLILTLTLTLTPTLTLTLTLTPV